MHQLLQNEEVDEVEEEEEGKHIRLKYKDTWAERFYGYFFSFWRFSFRHTLCSENITVPTYVACVS